MGSLWLESHPKRQKHMSVFHLLNNTSSTKTHLLFCSLIPFHFCLGSFCINTTQLLWEVLEEQLKVLVRGKEAIETFREIMEGGLRLGDCAEEVLEVDLTANNSLRQPPPSTIKVLSHLQTQENNIALT